MYVLLEGVCLAVHPAGGLLYAAQKLDETGKIEKHTESHGSVRCKDCSSDMGVSACVSPLVRIKWEETSGCAGKSGNRDDLCRNRLRPEVSSVISAAVMLTMSSILYSLRLSGSGGSFPKPLTAAEEREYLLRSAQGDQEARNILIERNLRLVAHIMKKYYTQSADQDDLISIGTIGLIKAISTFNVEKGARLATYAARCIENEVLMYFRSQKKSAGDVSLSELIETSGDGTALSLMDVICSDEDLFEQLSSREMSDRLRQAVQATLTDREKKIIFLRYGLDGSKPRTQREIAEVCGISRSYVSRIEKKALSKLEEALGLA